LTQDFSVRYLHHFLVRYAAELPHAAALYGHIYLVQPDREQIRVQKSNWNAFRPILWKGVSLATAGVLATMVTSGSAFPAVYVAGAILGNSPWAQREINVNFFESLSWLMETGWPL
jgi:NhaP-type Na+/H+ and K+/H+ antiporter